MINWSVELLELDRLHRDEERASLGIVKAQPFEAHADAASLTMAHRALAAVLDTEHVEFLRHANGWNGFSGNIDLFGTADFVGSARFKKAQEWVNQMDRRVLGGYAKQRAQLLPVGKSSASTDLLLMVNQEGQLQRKVLWFANELIEEFDSFNQMFVSFKAYARTAIDYWNKRIPLTGK